MLHVRSWQAYSLGKTGKWVRSCPDLSFDGPVLIVTGLSLLIN